MNKLNNWIDKNINKVLFYYLLMQPFLDVIAGIFTMFDIKNITLVDDTNRIFYTGNR